MPCTELSVFSFSTPNMSCYYRYSHNTKYGCLALRCNVNSTSCSLNPWLQFLVHFVRFPCYYAWSRRCPLCVIWGKKSLCIQNGLSYLTLIHDFGLGCLINQSISMVVEELVLDGSWSNWSLGVLAHMSAMFGICIYSSLILWIGSTENCERASSWVG
jgi:hypothetical protein